MLLFFEHFGTYLPASDVLAPSSEPETTQTPLESNLFLFLSRLPCEWSDLLSGTKFV